MWSSRRRKFQNTLDEASHGIFPLPPVKLKAGPGSELHASGHSAGLMDTTNDESADTQAPSGGVDGLLLEDNAPGRLQSVLPAISLTCSP